MYTLNLFLILGWAAAVIIYVGFPIDKYLKRIPFRKKTRSNQDRVVSVNAISMGFMRGEIFSARDLGSGAPFYWTFVLFFSFGCGEGTLKMPLRFGGEVRGYGMSETRRAS